MLKCIGNVCPTIDGRLRQDMAQLKLMKAKDFNRQI